MKQPVVSTARGVVWAVASCAVVAATFIATLAILAFVSANTDTPHVLESAAWPVAWGLLALLGTYGTARLAFGAWLPIHRQGVAIATVGLAMAATAQIVLLEWRISRGFTDPESVGWTGNLALVLVGVAITAFAASIAPKTLGVWPVAAVLVAAAGVASMTLINLPGLQGGIEASSWPLAVLLGLSALYAVATVGLIGGHAFRRGHGY